MRIRRIYVLSQGGLGNQLFQAAFAHKLATTFEDVRICFVDANLKGDRGFELGGLFDGCSHVHQKKMISIKGVSPLSIFFAFRRRYSRLTEKLTESRLYIEPNYLGDIRISVREFKNLRDTIEQYSKRSLILIGNFQMSSIIDFENNCFLECLDALLSKNTPLNLPKEFGVLHVRRGDYVGSIGFGELSIEYFSKSLFKFNSGIRDWLFITEADEFTHILRRELSKSVNLITVDETSPLNLLSIMTTSQTFIGSNSSLSWWAAYLVIKRGGKAGLPDLWKRNLFTSTLNLDFPGLTLIPSEL